MTIATAVIVKRVFAAPREKVFDAWVNPKIMALWFARCQHAPPVEVQQADARPGGSYQLLVTDDKGKVYRGHGVYQEVRHPEKLVFTWHWEHDDYGESLVTVDFRALGESNSTEVTLTHEALPDRAREDHRKGWEECYDLLALTLQP